MKDVNIEDRSKVLVNKYSCIIEAQNSYDLGLGNVYDQQSSYNDSNQEMNEINQSRSFSTTKTDQSFFPENTRANEINTAITHANSSRDLGGVAKHKEDESQKFYRHYNEIDPWSSN